MSCEIQKSASLLTSTLNNKMPLFNIKFDYLNSNLLFSRSVYYRDKSFQSSQNAAVAAGKIRFVLATVTQYRKQTSPFIPMLSFRYISSG